MPVLRRVTPGDAVRLAHIVATLDHVEARLFSEACREGMVPEVHALLGDDGGGALGAIALLDRPDYLSVQCAFQRDAVLPGETLPTIKRMVSSALPCQDRRRLFLKTNLYRPDIRALAADLGFQEYNTGWEMTLDLSDDPGRFVDAGALEVRDYDPSDAQAYIELLDDAFMNLHLRTGGNPTTFRDSALDWMDKMEDGSREGAFHGFWLDGEAVGLCLFHGDTVEPIAVHPRYHGKGYGREIMFRGIARTAPVKGWDRVWLFVVEANTDARDFYLHLGFRVVGEYSESVMPRT